MSAAKAATCVVVRDVEGPVGGHRGAERTGVGDRLGQPFGVAIGEEQLGALGGQLQRRRAADAAGRPGQEAPLAREPAPLRHGGRPYLVVA